MRLLNSPRLEIITQNPEETRKVGCFLAEEVIRELKRFSKKKAWVIGLKGDLGGGKTTFVQGFARGCGVKEKITSPTFVVFKRYSLSVSGLKNQRAYFYHIDCYRIKDSQELLELGIDEILLTPFNIVLIEWAERIKKILPSDTIWISFFYLSLYKRRIVL